MLKKQNDYIEEKIKILSKKDRDLAREQWEEFLEVVTNILIHKLEEK